MTVKPSAESSSIFPLTNCLQAPRSSPAAEATQAIHKLQSKKFLQRNWDDVSASPETDKTFSTTRI